MVKETPGRRRRLAAVWFADIVGYTDLSARDEDAALRVVDVLQATATEAVEAEQGRVVKHLGDAVLCVFDSADAALVSALALQRSFHASETVKALGVSIRVGLHVGEVVEAEDGDVYGDGVNTASRVEGIAEAGQVAVTDVVYQQIRNRPEYVSTSLGSRELKGIPHPVPIWAVRHKGDAAPHPVAPLPKPRRTRRVDRRAISIGLAASIAGFIGLSMVVAGRPWEEPGGAQTAAGDTAATEIDQGAIDVPAAEDTPRRRQGEAGRENDPGLGARGAARPSEPVPRWSVTDQTDPLTDARVLTLTTAGANGVLLRLRCQGGRNPMEVALVWPSDVESDDLRVRMGAGRAQQQRWSRGDDRRTLTYRGDARRLIRSLQANPALVVGQGEASGPRLMAQFDLSGLQDAAAPLREVCTW